MEQKESLFIVYIVFFLCAAAFATLVNSIFLRFARTLGIRETSSTIIRWSSVSKPAFGGISFFIVFLLSAASYPIFFQNPELFPNSQVLGLLGSTALAFVMGLADDAYNTRPFLKFGAQISCGVILIATGTYIDVFDYTWANYALTIIWVVGIMNSINMLDNMDGITTVTSTGIVLMALTYLILQGDWQNPNFIIMLGVLAALIGFLFINWHPSKMFMGDTGSQFLGIFLAAIGIHFFWNSSGPDNLDINSRQFVSVMLAFALPIIDTTTVFINRILRKQSPFVGGKDHTTHHLSYLGLSDSQIALTFLGLSIVSFCLILIIFGFLEEWTTTHTWIFSSYFLVLLGVFYYIGSINKDRRS